LGCAVGDADNGSRSDWVSCETKNDCGDGESCVEKRCEAVETEPEPEDGDEPEPEDGDEPEPEDGDEPGTSPRPDASAPVSMEPDPVDAVTPTPMGADLEPNATGEANTPPNIEAATGDGGVDAGPAAADPRDGGSLTGDSGASCTEEDPCYSRAECVQEQVSAYGNECTTQGTCTQNVEIDGMVATRQQYIYLYCTTTNGNLYQCSCDGAGSLTVTAVGQDGFAACAAALSNCGSRLRL
jgi:hypothetical protein